MSGQEATDCVTNPSSAADRSRSGPRMASLVRDHQADVLSYARSHMPPAIARSVDPQDILQDVYLDAFRRLAEFVPRGPEADLRWLLTITRNRIINMTVAWKTSKRGGSRTNVLDVPSDEDSIALLLEQLAIYSRTPSQSAIAHEQAAQIQKSLDSLPPEHRQVLRQRYIEAQPVEAVARNMRRSVQAIHMLTSRALTSLRTTVLRELSA